MDLSVVVPCYNEEKVMRELHARLIDSIDSLKIRAEVILVNDGSRDNTWPIMLELAARDPRLVLVNLSRNHGHQLALTAGLFQTVGQRIFILDADLQDPPELLPAMMEAMDSGIDVVYGVRRHREGESPLKLATASLFYRLLERLTDVPIPRDAGDFRLINRRTLEVLLAMPERHRFVRGMVSWIGFRQEQMMYDRHARFAGTTKYPYWRMLKFAFDAITAFSIKPLALASWAGIIAGMFAIGLMLFSIAAWSQGRTEVGWTSTMATVTFLGSVQLVVLGILGEYLGRLYEESRGRPLFVIQDIVRAGEPVEARPFHTSAPARDNHRRLHKALPRPIPARKRPNGHARRRRQA